MHNFKFSKSFIGIVCLLLAAFLIFDAFTVGWLTHPIYAFGFTELKLAFLFIIASVVAFIFGTKNTNDNGSDKKISRIFLIVFATVGLFFVALIFFVLFSLRGARFYP